MNVGLLISTYNWPEALEAVLKSLSAQVRLPEEILIADDGSGKETAELIKNFQTFSPVPVKHVWQEDRGFRKSAILNKAVAESTSDYIVQLDGDCIMHPYFMDDHIQLAQKNTYLYGSRVNIKPGVLPKVLSGNIGRFKGYSMSLKNMTRDIRIPAFQKIYKPVSYFSPKTRGCNISYWRKDFIEVNGYDETMEGWGREDSEFVLRLINKGVKGKRLRFGGIVYHLWHPDKSRDKLAENSRIQQKTITEKKIWNENGVDKYIK